MKREQKKGTFREKVYQSFLESVIRMKYLCFRNVI